MSRQRELLNLAFGLIQDLAFDAGIDLGKNSTFGEIKKELEKPLNKDEPIGQVGGLGKVAWFNGLPKRGTYVYAPKKEEVAS